MFQSWRSACLGLKEVGFCVELYIEKHKCTLKGRSVSG